MNHPLDCRVMGEGFPGFCGRFPVELLEPLNLGKVYTDGNYGYYERFSPEVLTVTKKNIKKIERKHLSLRT